MYRVILPLLVLTWTLGQYRVLPADCRFHSWSPDGSQIACLKDYVLYFLDLDGGNYHAVAEVMNKYPIFQRSPDGELLLILGPGSDSDASADLDLYVVDPKAGTRVAVSAGLKYETAETWSPDSREILFWASAANDVGDDLYVVSRDGNARRNLTADLYGDSSAIARWSPDSEVIVFKAREALDLSDNANIYVVGRDGAGRMNLTAGLYGGVVYAWTRDSEKVLVSARETADTRVDEDLYFLLRDGTGRVNLSAGLRQEFDPTWSPNGQHFVFRAEEGLYLVDIADDRATQLAAWGEDLDHRASEHAPHWSPDGSRIAYIGDREVVVAKADGAQAKRVGAVTLGWELAWSPDGTQLAYSDLDTLYVATLTDGTVLPVFNQRVGHLQWSPDGAWLVCTIFEGVTTYLVAADGSFVTTLFDPATLTADRGGQASHAAGLVSEMHWLSYSVKWSSDSQHLLGKLVETKEYTHPAGAAPAAFITTQKYFAYVHHLHDGGGTLPLGEVVGFKDWWRDSNLELVAWSPDSQWIGLSKEDGIYVIPAQ